MKKTIKLLFLSILTILAFASCGDKKETAASSEGKASNELVIYSPNTDTEVNAIIPAFEKATGIKVILQSMGTGDVLARINAEKENPQADINWGAINIAFYNSNPGLWEEYVSPNDKDLPEAYQSYNGFFTYSKLSGSAALLLNTDVFKELGLNVDDFDGYEDLLWSELKGKIAMGDPTASSSALAELTNMLLVMGDKPYDEKAWQFVEKFIGQLNKTIISSSSQIYKATADGEYAVGVTYEDPAIGLLEDGAKNLKVVYPKEGAVWLPGGIAIIKNAPNLENAKKFIDFIISKEGQELLAPTTIRPVMTSIKNTSSNMKAFEDINMAFEDIEYTSKMKNEWQQRWTDILTK